VNRYLPYLGPAVSGLLLVLAFPKADLGFMAWAALVPLIVSLDGKSPGTGFMRGMAAGFVFFAGSLYWLVFTMNSYGGIPLAVAISLYILLSCYLALYFGAFGFLYALTRKHTGLSPVLFAPLYWVSLELARNYALTGFPWNLLGYSQHGFLHVIQVADITAVYGVSALIVGVNAALAEIYLAVKRGDKPGRGWYVSTAAAAAVFIAVIGYGHYRLTNPAGDGKTLKVALIQGNIDQMVKWDDQFRLKIFGTYRDITMTAAKAHPDLIIWPETAVPFSLEDPAGMDMLDEVARSAGTDLMTGIASFTMTGGGYVGRNSAILLSPSKGAIGRYDKLHLVPFGEYVPLQKLLPFVRKMTAGIGDFVPGSGPNLMGDKDWKFGTAVCYEVIFPELVREFPDEGADFLVSITNDAWFGKSAAPYQHFDMAGFRAVENRRALVRAANTGITGVILPDGTVSAKTDIFTEGYVIRDIPLIKEKTFYTRHGDVFAYLCLLGALAIAGRAVLNKRGGTPR